MVALYLTIFFYKDLYKYKQQLKPSNKTTIADQQTFKFTKQDMNFVNKQLTANQ